MTKDLKIFAKEPVKEAEVLIEAKMVFHRKGCKSAVITMKPILMFDDTTVEQIVGIFETQIMEGLHSVMTQKPTKIITEDKEITIQ